MTTPVARMQHRRFHAPREDRAALVEPPFCDLSGVVDANVHLRAQHNYDFQGRSLVQVSRQARRELLREAQRWTSAYRDLDPSLLGRAELIFLAGHQPQLFHPGVWFKNFALGHLARQFGAVGVNLLIDSDTVKSTGLPVPGGSRCEPHTASIPLDRPDVPVPYEERRIMDRQLFADFGRHTLQQIAPLIPDPLVRRYWPLAVGRARQIDNLGACLAQSRHQLEGAWGLQTLEVPQSRVCQSESFAWLTAHLLARLPRLWEVHNQAVQEYRQVYRIRSASHPVPDLTTDGEWLEAPFWIWTAEDPTRRPLLVRQRGDEIVLSDRHALQIGLPLAPESDASQAVQRLMELSGRGVKIRGRALITTLWARLVMGDLFLHGIGGAKYDQVTDVLIQRFFGLKPPSFLVLSATLYLPLEQPPGMAEDVQPIDRQLRELAYHPERYIDGAAALHHGGNPAELIAAKTRWIQTPPTADTARIRCREIRRINEALQPCVDPQRQRLLKLRLQRDRMLRACAVLSWREYGFCLYPENTLREFLFGLLAKGP